MSKPVLDRLFLELSQHVGPETYTQKEKRLATCNAKLRDEIERLRDENAKLKHA